MPPGLEEDCPFDPAHPDEALSEEVADALPAEAFVEYASRLYQYLLVGALGQHTPAAANVMRLASGFRASSATQRARQHAFSLNPGMHGFGAAPLHGGRCTLVRPLSSMLLRLQKRALLHT